MDGIPLPQRSGSTLRPGAELRVAAGPGARGYVAVGGGIAVPRILGSCSTDLRGRFGGFDGRPLRAGDRLAMGRSASGPLRWVGHPREEGPIRIVPGPHAEGILHAFDGASFRAGTEADRTGVRMEELLAGGGETASMGLPLGAIQLPPDGRPIVMLADRPVTGGYRIPAVVIRADVSRVAQLRPGDPLRLALVSIDEARHAWRRAEEELAALDPLDEREDGELGWTGSHR